MNITVLKVIGDQVVDRWDIEVGNVERDNDDFVSVYGMEERGMMHYMILDQETIDEIKRT